MIEIGNKATRRRRRGYESTDSDEVEFIQDRNLREHSKIKNEILKTAVVEFDEPNMELTSFYDEEGIQKSRCRDII